MNNLEMRFLTNPMTGRLDLYIVKTSKGKRLIAKLDNFEEVPDGAYFSPCASLEWNAGQSFANQLWDLGIRPEQSKQSQGAHEAQGRHLDDMRAIAFAKLNVEKPA